MNKFIVLSTIIGLITFATPSIEAGVQKQRNLHQICETNEMHVGITIPACIPICCPACKRPCGFMGLTTCICYKERMAAKALAEKEAAMKEAALKEAALAEKEAQSKAAQKSS
jgi:hypothetical protein